MKSYDTDFTLLISDDSIYYLTECWLLLMIENGLISSIVNNSFPVFFPMQLILVPVLIWYGIEGLRERTK